MESINKHKEPLDLVKEIYNVWGWGKEAGFMEFVKSKTAEEFAISYHDNLGMQIRNSYGFWKGDTDLYNWFIAKGIKHPDEMSHYIFLEIHKYALEQEAKEA